MSEEESAMSIIRSLRPKFRNYADKIAFALNGVFLVTGFKLSATGAPAFSDDALTTPISYASNMDGWDEYEDRYAFVYYSPNFQMKVVIKCYLVNNHYFSIDALAAGSSRPLHYDIVISDFVEQNNDNKFPTYASHYKNFPRLVRRIIKYLVLKLIRPSSKSSSRKRRSQEEEEKVEEEEEDQDENKGEGNDEKENEVKALEGKAARMCLTDKKKRKNVKSASISKPYKRRSMKNNKNQQKNNSITAGSKEEHAITLYDLPYGIYTNMKNAIAVMEYLETHKDDKQASAKLNRFEYYIDVLTKFHHLKPVDLPTGWKYDRTKAKEVVSGCYWEKLSYFES